MKELTQLQRYFLSEATEKARLRGMTVNGQPAIVFILRKNQSKTKTKTQKSLVLRFTNI